MVTMSEVAKAAGVSQAAVSYAYSRPSKVSSGQRARIFEVAEELGYHGPDAAGRSLRGGRVGAVGVMVMDSLGYAFSDPSNMQLLRGNRHRLEGHDIARDENRCNVVVIQKLAGRFGVVFELETSCFNDRN